MSREKSSITPVSKQDDHSNTGVKFSQLNLPSTILSSLEELGYETPTPIQAQTIPHLLKGLDMLGHAPTGTGKTAAFALPLLSRLDLKNQQVQVMVLTPTRELAIQVAEAFQRYAKHLPNFHVLPIYGGQDYTGQIRQLKRGVHVVVGTPGRVMDHMRKGTLKLGGLQTLVLDEADEMLRMGFIDDVEWILEQTPANRQMALFSATMPKEIQRIARRHLDDPQEISIKAKTATAETIRQRYWSVGHHHKMDVLTRILEFEAFDAILIFVRTRTATTDLASRLEARGYAVAALSGDMAQKQREQMVERLKRGSLDILVATDVAARGLDVERISHVINYDIPSDTESYIHRIGRTGRAGRSGEAILFVTPREQRMLGAIEKATRQKIEKLALPTTEMVNNKRIADFKQSISDSLAAGELGFMRNLVEQYQQEHNVPAIDIAASLAKMFIGEKPLLLKDEARQSPKKDKKQKNQDKAASRSSVEHGNDRKRSAKENTERTGKSRDFKIKPDAPFKPDVPFKSKDSVKSSKERSPQLSNEKPDSGMERFRLEVGEKHDAKPANIVGAIANEAGLEALHIGRIEIKEDHSLVDLPMGMPKAIFQDLRKAWVCGQKLNISRLTPTIKKKKFEPEDELTMKLKKSSNPSRKKSRDKQPGKSKNSDKKRNKTVS